MNKQPTHKTLLTKTLVLLVLISLALQTQSKCVFKVDDQGLPIKLKQGENQPKIIQPNNNCKQYIGKMGCCDQNNDKEQDGSYIEIDSIFGYKGGGCDHCSINLKRFWCEYACSPNQSDFMIASQEYSPVPDPQKPGQNISVQMINLTVEAQTACDLYNSCKRNSFVSSVSAMGSPAGFLTFQGHNAVNQAFQFIQVDFSYNKSLALTFSDDNEQIPEKSLSSCDTKVNTSLWHSFKFKQNCRCSTCEQACDKNSGFIYTQSSVFQGFNWLLVGGVYLFFGAIAVVITLVRKRSKQKQN